MDKKRNSNIELLRIIACLLITFNHIFSKGVPKATIVADCDTLNAALCVLFFQGGKYGCNIFSSSAPGSSSIQASISAPR